MVPMVRTPIMFAVSMRLPAANLSEFVKLARDNKLNCAGSSASSVFVGKYMFKQLALNHIQFVPFKGSNDMIVQLISGNIDCAFETNLVTGPLAQDRKIRVLASGGQSRSGELSLFSDTVPGLSFYNWSGVSMLKAVPAAEKDRIFSVLRNAARDPVYRNTMNALGLEVVENPVVNEAWLNSEYQKYETVRQQLGITRLD
jgi:tripartite-type tricarboxylate transporter receptor subunit TctC